MSESLPPHPTLEALKKQAKQLLAAHRSGDAAICSQLRAIPCFAEATEADILAAKLPLADAQFAVARSYGFDTWAALKERVQSPAQKKISITVFGRITRKTTGQPIEGVEVRIQVEVKYLTPLAYVCLKTDSDGRYEGQLEWAGSDRPGVKIQCRHETTRFIWMSDLRQEEDGAHLPKKLISGERLEYDLQL